MGHFKGAIAIVTGGASGIGRALCRQLVREEAGAVIVADINGEQARQAAAEISGGGAVMAAPLDVTQSEAVRTLVEETVSRHGRLDYMFNNAGIAVRGEFQDMDLEQWRKVMDVNLWGVIHGCTWAYRAMVDQGFGHIVNVSSAAGLAPMPLATAYAASKHAVVGLSTSLRAEGTGLGVRVSVACPGFVRTGIYDAALSTARLPSGGRYLNRSALKIMEPEACARVILKGVERNRAIIPVTRFVWLLWLFNRLSPERGPNLFMRRIKKRRAAAGHDEVS